MLAVDEVMLIASLLVVLSPSSPMFTVVRSTNDVEMLQGPLQISKEQPAEATFFVLKKPRAVTVRVVERDGGIEVIGAEVHRIDLPYRFDRLEVRVPRAEVFVFKASEGRSCSGTAHGGAYVMRDGGVEPLLSVANVGGDRGHEGSFLFWGAPAGGDTCLVGFHRIDLVAGVPLSTLVTRIDEALNDRTLTCSTRTRYRFNGDSLEVLDVSDGGCPLER